MVNSYRFYLKFTYLRERMLRLAVLGYCWDLAYLVSLPVGAWLFDSGCYNCVFGTSLVLYVLASCLGLLRLWGFQEKMKAGKTSIKGRQSKQLMMG